MNPPQPHISVRSAIDILDVLPTLLGFIPTESLVVIYLDTLNGRARLAMTARMDLPTDRTEFTAAQQVIDQHAQRHDAIILVAYSVDFAIADSTLRAGVWVTPIPRTVTTGPATSA